MSVRLLAKAALLLVVVTGFTTVAQDQGRTENEKVPAVGPMNAKSAAEANRVEPRKLRVLFITAESCEKCERELNR